MSAPERELAPVGKLLQPLARELVETMAVTVGTCVRPIAVRRTDTRTGESVVVPIPFGMTRATKCPSCAGSGSDAADLAGP